MATQMRVIGVYQGEPVLDHVDFETGVKCPNCDTEAGEEDSDHPGSFECLACGFVWSDAPLNIDIEDYRGDR